MKIHVSFRESFQAMRRRRREAPQSGNAHFGMALNQMRRDSLDQVRNVRAEEADELELYYVQCNTSC